jgi:GDP-4-dehydro-6-deoxy-D-mannose reductase
MRILVTGIGGFAGRHLASALIALGHEVHGTVSGTAGKARLADVSGGSAVATDARLHILDVRDAGAAQALLAQVRPQGLFHLAGIALVGGTNRDPAAVFAVNAVGTLNVLAAVRAHAPECRVLVVGSGDAYGALGAADLPVREDCRFRPLSSYGASKAAADLIAHQWAHGYGLDVVRVRPFNHTGPGQGRGFVCPDFAEQLVAIEQKRRPPRIAVGNLDVVRDFSDVRDVVAGYVAAWEKGQSGEAYNVCSGTGRSIRAVLDALLELTRLPVEVVVDTSLVRAHDVPELVGSPDRLRSETGWQPRHPWRDTLTDVLEDWRARG